MTPFMPYTVILDLSRPRDFDHWRAAPEDIAAVFERLAAMLSRPAVLEVRIVRGQAPDGVAPVLRLPHANVRPACEAAPTLAVVRAAAGIEGDVVLLTGGNIWIEPQLDELVDEHRRSRRRVSLCTFHAGFEPIITSAAALLETGPVLNIHRHLLRLAEDAASGVVEVRRPIPNLNLYARPDLPEGWRCLAWASRQMQPRELWRPPVHFRQGYLLTRENYRRSFRAMSTFRALEGARVLEIGCSPTIELGPRMLFEEFGIRQYTGVNLDPIKFRWRHPRASFHVGDAALAPFAPASFDVVFSIAVWEHVQRPRVLFHKIPGWLASGGGHYGKFQVWSSAHGYHLPPGGFPTRRQPPFCHLTMTPAQLREHIVAAADPALADRGVERVFTDHYINRVPAGEFLDIIKTCGLEVVYLDGRCGGRLTDQARCASERLASRFTPEELSVEGFEFYLRKSDFRLMDLGPAPPAAAVA